MNKKTFVIAGGSTGVAKQVVSELIKLGHNVVFGDLDVKNELKEKQLLSVYTDVTNVNDCEKLFKLAYKTFGKIDGFFSYAGITPAQSLLECTEDVYNNIFDVNVKGAIFCSKYAVKYMKENKGGSIVFTGSPHSDAGEIDRVS